MRKPTKPTKDEQPDEETTVYFLCGSKSRGYHYDEECRRLAKSDRRIDDATEKEAKQWNRNPCRFCVVGDVDKTREGPSLAATIRSGNYTIE